jgi:hypothetical protein
MWVIRDYHVLCTIERSGLSATGLRPPLPISCTEDFSLLLIAYRGWVKS